VTPIRLPILLAVLLVACGDGSARKSEATAAPLPTVAGEKQAERATTAQLDVPASGPLVACEGLLRLNEEKEKCEPTAEGKAYLRRYREQLPNHWADAKDIGARRRAARGCALMLDQLAADLPPNCPVQLTAAERAWVDSEAGRRTTIPPTGDAAIDALIAELLGLRDRMCACQDRPCADTANQEFLQLAPHLLGGQSTVDREAGAKVVEELQHCRAMAAPASTP
jgi:hypothetical protein